MKTSLKPPVQATMFDVFEQAEQEARTAHLPSSMPEAILYYRQLLQRHHDALIAADAEEAFRLNEEAHDLAAKLNGGETCGIIAGEDAPGCILERETAAPQGEIPLYGQLGDFITQIEGIRVRIEMDGIFGVASGMMIWPGFAAHAVDYDRPFISETGYRSFLGYHVAIEPGITPGQLVRRVICAHIANKKYGLKGKLVSIKPEYAERHHTPICSE